MLTHSAFKCNYPFKEINIHINFLPSKLEMLSTHWCHTHYLTSTIIHLLLLAVELPALCKSILGVTLLSGTHSLSSKRPSDLSIYLKNNFFMLNCCGYGLGMFRVQCQSSMTLHPFCTSTTTPSTSETSTNNILLSESDVWLVATGHSLA